MSCFPAMPARGPCHTMGAQPRAGWPARALGGLVHALAAVGEGIAAARRYQRLKAAGAPHDTAIRRALGADPPNRRETARALYFAGQA